MDLYFYFLLYFIFSLRLIDVAYLGSKRVAPFSPLVSVNFFFFEVTIYFLIRIKIILVELCFGFWLSLAIRLFRFKTDLNSC